MSDEEAAEIFLVLGNPRRVHIIRLLASGNMASGELASSVAVAWPNVSQHLAILRHAGLVVRRRVGSRQIYSLNQRALLPIFSLLTKCIPDMHNHTVPPEG